MGYHSPDATVPASGNEVAWRTARPQTVNSTHEPPAQRMSWLSRLLGGKSESKARPQRLDYLKEALVLERQGDYDAALTSYRLALRDTPNDLRVLQNMAIAFSVRIGRIDEAIRAYRRALEIDPALAGAHYGIAFLLVKRDDPTGATKHLQAFLAHPPSGEEAERWIRHAQATVEQLRNPAGGAAPANEG